MAYKKCPRCELNWIKTEEEYCDVCKTELKMKGGIALIEDEDEEMFEEERLCPECKVNYLDEDEKTCPSCRIALSKKVTLEKDIIVPDVTESADDDESWRDFVEDEPADDGIDNGAIEVSLQELEEEENEGLDEDEDDEDDFGALNLDDYEDDEDEDYEEEDD